MSKQRSLTPREVNNTIKFFIKGNRKLEVDGKLKNAIAFIGEAGVSKTSVVMQTADELGMKCSKISLSMIDDLGDVVGYPLIEYELETGNWVDEKELTILLKTGVKTTGKTRTGYAPPKWVTNLDGKENILLIDDFNRANPRFMQAVMELIDRQTYYGWKLPKGTTIILTGNPEDGEYHVTEQDQAQNTRFFRYNVRFDVDDWARHAELSGVDGRCINFLIRYHNEVIPHADAKLRGEGRLATNPRQWTKFFNAISILDDFSAEESLVRVMDVGSGIVPDHIHVFATFLSKKLDKLIDPKMLFLHKDFDYVKQEVHSAVGKIADSTYKSEIASILSTRLANFAIKYVQDKPLTDELCDRLENIAKDGLFGADLNVKMFRDLYQNNMSKFRKLLIRPYYSQVISGKI